MNLYLICTLLESDIELDLFVNATSPTEAVESWKRHFPLSYAHGDELNVIRVPTDHGILGVIPWETIHVDDVVL